MHQPRGQLDGTGRAMHDFIAELLPLHRSLGGRGLRATFDRMAERIPLEIEMVPSGTRVFDWQVPEEWNIHDAYIADESGRRLVDYRQSNLHVAGYSRPVDSTMSWAELKPHLATLPDRPDAIPYRTLHFREGWQFCLSRRTWDQLDREGDGARYRVRIDSEFSAGGLLLAECRLPATIAADESAPREVLFWCHTCHPSLANDNLSALAVAVRLAESLRDRPRRFTYRFLFGAATIGAIAWQARNQDSFPRIAAGLVLAGCGDSGPLHYKAGRDETAWIDRACRHLLAHADPAGCILSFSPDGYDERQFCSPGIDLPFGCLMRTPPGAYPQYHTSADNLEFVQPAALAGSLAACLDLVQVLEEDRAYVNLKPHGEPQLGRHGLYRAYGESGRDDFSREAVLWVLNLSDGGHSLLQVAERSGLPFAVIHQAALALQRVGLLREAQTGPPDTS